MSDFDKVIDAAIPVIAIRIQNELRIACPVDTGRLRNSIKVYPTATGIKISMLDYGKNVEFGTAPHIIKPKDKKALSWKKAEHPVKKVKHPGTRPNPFIRNTIRNKMKNIVVEEIRNNI